MSQGGFAWFRGIQMDCVNPRGRFRHRWVVEFTRETKKVIGKDGYIYEDENDSGLLNVSIFPLEEKEFGYTWHNVSKIEFIFMPGIGYGMRLHSTTTSAVEVGNQNGWLYQGDEPDYYQVIRFSKHEIDQYKNDWHQKFDKTCNWTEDGKSMIVESLTRHSHTQQNLEEAGVEEQSPESMTIESLLGMEKKDWNYYDVLGITASSTLEEIKKAYKKRAMEWHPDKNTSSKQPENIMTYVFKLILEAYETLSNSGKREEYDSSLSHNHEKWHLKNMNPYIIVY